MYKLEFTLKQHTPLIHFQHDQAGATLRATEVKPKLDKFIIEKLLTEQNIPFDYFNDKHEFINAREAFKLETQDPITEIQKKWASWLVGKGRNEHVALDYKLRFESAAVITYLIASRLSKKQQDAIGNKFKYISDSPFFAEEESIGELFQKQGDDQIVLKSDYQKRFNLIDKLGILSQDEIGNNIEIKGAIIVIGQDLFKTIKDSLIHFFIINNFGSRQNKGFGSFSIATINNEPQTYNCDSFVPRPCYKYSRNIKTIDEVFRIINSDYKNLKANAATKDSKLRDYFNEQFGIEWEKKALYDHVNGFPVNKNKTQYIRSYLGLAELFDFRHKPAFRVKLKHLVENKEDEITRFQSPLLFKYLNGNLYLIFEEIPEKIKGQRFEFRFEDGLNEPLILNTPSVSENFISEFLSEKLNNYNWRKLS